MLEHLKKAQFDQNEKAKILDFLFLNDNELSRHILIRYHQAEILRTTEDLINYLGTLGLITYKPFGKFGV